jgi:hypothetical protein
MPLPADYCWIIESGLYVSQEAIEDIHRIGPRSKFHDSKIIRLALTEHRLSKYRNLKRAGYERAFCYVCIPPQRYDDKGQLVARKPERLFLVYARLDQYGEVVFDWEWRPGSESSGILYDGQSFGERIDGPNL